MQMANFFQPSNGEMGLTPATKKIVAQKELDEANHKDFYIFNGLTKAEAERRLKIWRDVHGG